MATLLVSEKPLRKAVFHSYCLSKSFLWDCFFLCPQRNTGRPCHSSVQTRATQIVLPSLQVTQHPVRMVTNVSSPTTKSLQSCPTLCDPTDGSPSGSAVPGPWDSPGKNTGVGCHFLLQFMKVKSEIEVTQPCPALRDPMDCSLPGSSLHGIFQARVLEWGCHCLLLVCDCCYCC